jgi:hypothetical protein
MVNSMALFDYQRNSFEVHCTSGASINEWKEMCSMLCLAIGGLLALIFVLSLGGAFALLGPWAILAGTWVFRIQRRW